ncbi:histidine kinase N-terminal 7TM domain-containing protein [Candidatus Hodarchaeum mangrovi]
MILTLEFNIYALLMGAVSLLSIYLLIYTLLFRQRTQLNIVFALMISSCVIWCTGYTLDIAAIDFDFMLLLIKFQYIGIATLPPLFLIFVLIFTKRENLALKPLLLLIFLPSLIHYLLMITTGEHKLFYSEIQLNTDPPFNNLMLTYGPAFYSHTVYSYILIISGIILLMLSFLKERKNPIKNILYEKQLFIMVIGSFPPILGNIIRISGIFPQLQFFDLTPIAFSITFVLFTYAIIETGFLDIVPIARHRVVDEILDGLIITDLQKRVVDLNVSANRIFGLDRNDLASFYGRNVFAALKNYIPGKKSVEKLIELEEGANKIISGIISEYASEIELPKKHGRRTTEYFEINLSPLRKEVGSSLLGIVLNIRNITDRKIAENNLKDRNKMHELVLKLLSHDLRGHLFTLQGYAEIAKETQNIEEINESFTAIEAKGKAILTLIDEVTIYLKSLNQLKTQQYEKYDLLEIIAEIIKQIKTEIESKNLLIEYLYPPNLEMNILANLTIKSAIWNLLQNAVKYSPDNGKIKILCEDHQTEWKVIIEDAGSGIPKELRNKVFEPFAAFGSKAGIGLGLTIVWETITNFSGQIWIEDAIPKGTKFIFTLPKYLESY